MVTARREADIRTTIPRRGGGETSIRCVEKRAANGQYSLGWDTARERQYDGFSFVQM